MSQEKARILCVDDNPRNFELLKTMLAARGYEAVQARGGAEAMETIQSERVDIVLLDVMMPEMDGFQVCQKIKGDEHFRAIPVILITAYDDQEYRIAGIESGAEDFISRPFDMNELLARIQMLLNVKELNSQLTAAYSNITSLITCGEGIVSSLDPHRFDFMELVGKMVTGLIAAAPERTENPQFVLVGIQEENGAHRWLKYHHGTCLHVTELEGDLGPEFALLAGRPGISWFNRSEMSAADRVQLDVAVAPVTRFTANLVCYLGDSFSVCAVNYGRRVTGYDGEVLKSIATQSLFLRSLSAQIKETDEAFAYTVFALARAAEANDDDTGNHLARVGEYCALLARSIGMSEDFVAQIRLQSQMHDVGKIHIPSQILKKPEQLQPEEFEVIKQHTLYGARILGDHVRFSLAKSIALSHHERYDGSGYPYGLKGEEIPLAGRILNIADQYDALRNRRIYKDAFDHETTCRIILNGDGRTMPEHFDPKLLGVFRDLSGEFDAIHVSFHQGKRARDLDGADAPPLLPPQRDPARRRTEPAS
ncbi:HD domain-containing phosphohydrolase [Geomesophilobacter sediminis]|uniref:Response regulator n=1 Tax=Geomesophilobacter sediminis TaxID=2798584 RepID=A0A8J7J6I4_9BACT|nr:HD domain-containing phosphohydrolase [Geomesophilobacter sediminis]MBJ6724421.1 response regulator [Geomesophilobacter sediminis]